MSRRLPAKPAHVSSDLPELILSERRGGVTLGVPRLSVAGRFWHWFTHGLADSSDEDTDTDS